MKTAALGALLACAVVLVCAQPAPLRAAPLAGAPERAVLYEEEPADPAGRQFPGTVSWRVETAAPSPGQPAETTVRADVAVAARGFALTLVLHKNTDRTLPASHKIDLSFTVPADDAHGGIKNVPGILMKPAEQTRGTPLAGLAVKVTDNVFLIGLSAADADRQRNVDLLRERAWVDIPIVYGDGRRAILAFDKGASGKRAFEQAFAAWGEADAARRPAPPAGRTPIPAQRLNDVPPRNDAPAHQQSDRQQGSGERPTADSDQTARLDPRGSLVLHDRSGGFPETENAGRSADHSADAIWQNPTTANADCGAAEARTHGSDAALMSFAELIRLNPRDASPYFNRGAVYRAKGQADCAIADFTEAIRLAPQWASAYTLRATAYGMKGDVERALSDLDDAIRLDPASAQAYASRGLADSAKGDLDRAVADLSEAIRLDPTLATAYCDRGGVYAMQGDHDRAIADFSAAIRLDPAMAPAYLSRAAAYRAKKDFAHATADFYQAARLGGRF